MNYIFLADGFETVEALGVVDMLRRAGVDICTVSMNATKEVTTSHRVTVLADTIFDENDYESAEMLILPGGMPGTNNLKANEKLCQVLIKHNDKNGKLAAVCAAPSILGELGFLKGKKACCFPGFEDKLIGANVSMREVEADGNCITSRGMGTVIPFSGKIIETLADKETADRILNAIQYKTSEE